ncbi:AMP-binding protein [Mycobacterium sp. DL99]|uniref:AMP-binding protein n=1 Tax=Mycobacterium sp. DL99 TaxID=2528957 RepID=UPI00108064E6|nr:AMP-binding protein [Mycobacterium sp. DL99]
MAQTAFPNADIWPREADIDPGGDVVADFAAVVRAWPHRAAIMHNGTVITYRDLADRVRRTALHYRATRFGDDEDSRLIGAVVAHVPAVVDLLLGSLQARAAYCPIDAALPAARKQALAAALGVNRLFAVARDPDDSTDLRIETLDEDPVLVDTDLQEPRCRPSDPAYVLCTSGSTGKPKPVVVSRRALAATVRALRHLFGITPDDRVLQFASLGWDTCLEEILPALTAGATLVFDDAAHSVALPRFVRMLAEREITVLDLPTAFWHELVLFLHEEQASLPACVRLVVIGGERVDPTRLRQWRDVDAGHVRLLNTYGCTETTMVTHAVDLCGPDTEPEVARCDGEIPIGRALPHVRDHVTDEGELLVSGPGLATCYLGLPELTESGFPVADHGSGPTRWFHTGDLVARGERGLLYSRGRTDEQVKVLGVRVHPAEVEAQLNTHPAVGGAVVTGERLLGRTALTAYVVPVGTITQVELKRYLGQRLPAQFVPSRVRFVDSLSYTSSGKIDRAATRRAARDHDGKGAGQ